MKIPDQLRPGDVLFYKPSSWVGFLIACLTGGWYSHVEVYLFDGKVFAARQEGVNIYPVRVDQYLCSVRRPANPRFSPPLAFAAIEPLIGKDYEFSALGKFLAPWLGSRKRYVARFCSSVVTSYLKGGGCNPFQKKVSPAKVSPYDLWMSAELYTVWGR